jgi:hypothetical protein
VGDVENGCFVVSLDFELHWGVLDRPLAPYRENLMGERRAIERMLSEFERREIHATWAVVGMLFARTREELLAMAPHERPTYLDESLSPYAAMERVGRDEHDDPLHFGRDVIEAIARTPHQEIGTHTFSHYYCLEPGQTAQQFEADLVAARQASADFGDACASLVLPRNQHNPAYDDVLRRAGVRAVRCGERQRVYRGVSARSEHPGRRLARLADTYAPVLGDRTFERPRPASGLVRVPASAFLRPYSPRLRSLDRLRVARVEREMTRAARAGRGFHLWWHPHNFGTHLEENIAVLSALLDTFAVLRERHGMTSRSMREIADGDW